jgi:2-succinyl-6-hydroxy-2,4-cyclohexadiene-1-carboxylate synthase
MLMTTVMGSPCAYDLKVPDDTRDDTPVDTLVFIHGWMLSREYWRPLIDQMADSYCCLSYDLLGFGQSQCCASTPRHDHSLQAYAQDLLNLLDDLGIENPWLVGHSLGGSIALWAADRAGDRIKGVICVNAGGGIYMEPAFGKFRSAGQKILKFRPPWLRHAPLLSRLMGRTMVHQPMGPVWGQQRLVDFLDADGLAARESLLASTTEAQVHQLPQVVARMRQPIHFITGTQDRVMEPGYVRHLASFHPSFHHKELVTELPNCGHMAMVEQTQQVAAQIEAVVKQGL